MIKLEKTFKDWDESTDYLYGDDSSHELDIAQAVNDSPHGIWVSNYVGDKDYSFFAGANRKQYDHGVVVTILMPECDQDVQNETLQEYREQLP